MAITTTTTDYTIIAYSADLRGNTMTITVQHTDTTDGTVIALTTYNLSLVTGSPIVDNKNRQIAANTPNSIINGQATFQATLQAVLDAAAAKIRP